ncbi:MAG: hypothetical protein KF809_10140 [Chloroflexi bacterium]|nr:hypothetical protein [Chloroflexota bacterium]
MSRIASPLLSLLAVLGLVLVLPVAAVAADACTVTVSPRTGEPGTRFVIRGQGFTPSTITLTRGDEEPRTIDVSGDQDSFRVGLIAAEADTGRWRVRAEGCSDTASLRVTLPPTATESVVTGEQDRTTELAAAVLLAVLFLGSTALLLPRLTRAARSR